MTLVRDETAPCLRPRRCVFLRRTGGCGGGRNEMATDSYVFCPGDKSCFFLVATKPPRYCCCRRSDVVTTMKQTCKINLIAIFSYFAQDKDFGTESPLRLNHHPSFTIHHIDFCTTLSTKKQLGRRTKHRNLTQSQPKRNQKLGVEWKEGGWEAVRMDGSGVAH